MHLRAADTAPRQAQPKTVALFVSDLHLCATMPQTAAAFFQFLRTEAMHVSALYLLGDIFEYWAGDDDLDDPFNRSVAEEIRAVSDQGVNVYWLAGNRDFLVGAAFAQACKLTLLTEPYVTSIGGRRLLLLHGDAECTDDLAYMAFRQQVRNPAWQRAFLARPLIERKAMIASMREGSRDAQRDKTMAIMDVNEAAINALFVTASVDAMIHGHTHRPACHQHHVAGRACVRYVLPDWDADGALPRGGWLAVDAAGTITVHQA